MVECDGGEGGGGGVEEGEVCEEGGPEWGEGVGERSDVGEGVKGRKYVCQAGGGHC